MKHINKKNVFYLSTLFVLLSLISILLFWGKGYLTNYECIQVHSLNTQSGGILLFKIEDEIILLGGGTEEDAQAVLEYLQVNQIEKVNTLILQEPTEAFCGGYTKIVGTLPIEKCYVFKSEGVDTYTSKLLASLKDAGTSFEMYKDYETYKIKGLKIEPFIVRGEGMVTNEFLGYNLYLPKFKYMWLPRNDYVQSIDWDNKNEFRPNVVNIGGRHRKAFLETGYLKTFKPETLILGDDRKVSKKEKKAILQLVPDETTIIDRNKEGYSILYLNEGTYSITTFEKLNSSVL